MHPSLFLMTGIGSKYVASNPPLRRRDSKGSVIQKTRGKKVELCLECLPNDGPVERLKTDLPNAKCMGLRRSHQALQGFES